jgi:hypothetical protein
VGWHFLYLTQENVKRLRVFNEKQSDPECGIVSSHVIDSHWLFYSYRITYTRCICLTRKLWSKLLVMQFNEKFKSIDLVGWHFLYLTQENVKRLTVYCPIVLVLFSEINTHILVTLSNVASLYGKCTNELTVFNTQCSDWWFSHYNIKNNSLSCFFWDDWNFGV